MVNWKSKSFKPYFRWSAPYTPNIEIYHKDGYAVLNLILDGQLLIHIEKMVKEQGCEVTVLNLVLDGRLLIPGAMNAGDLVKDFEF